MTEYFSEQLVPAHRQQLLCTDIIYQQKSETQDVVIFRNPRFGTVLALDNVVQTTEGDEFIYHEIVTHVPLLAHGEARNVLIIGGGDGGILRNVLLHQGVTSAVLVEIEPDVIEMTKRYLPTICGQCFEDPRAEIVIADGCAYVRETPRRFDVIIVDSTDAHGPGAVLFTPEFYADCRRCLALGGVMVTQSGVPFTQPDTIRDTNRHLRALFRDVSFFMATIPTYISGPMAFSFATDNPTLRQVDLKTLETRWTALSFDDGKYYTPAVHRAAFALPRYVEHIIG